jgi:hypothetical protein
MVFKDRVSEKAKLESINARNVTRSRIATSVRKFHTKELTWSLPLYRLTSLRVCAGAAQLLFALREN